VNHNRGLKSRSGQRIVPIDHPFLGKVPHGIVQHHLGGGGTEEGSAAATSVMARGTPRWWPKRNGLGGLRQGDRTLTSTGRSTQLENGESITISSTAKGGVR
jgi:hypothetical protein